MNARRAPTNSAPACLCCLVSISPYVAGQLVFCMVLFLSTVTLVQLWLHHLFCPFSLLGFYPSLIDLNRFLIDTDYKRETCYRAQVLVN